MTAPLSLDEVRHVARLARLRLTDRQLEEYRSQLATVLGHIATFSTLDVESVEPLAHPADVTNRLDDDTPASPLPVEQLLANAPAAESAYLLVPKVLPTDDAG